MRIAPPQRSRQPPQPKKTVTLESQLSVLRSQTDVWNIGKETAVLEEEIKKNERLN